MSGYRGRFAPSPTGDLHLGSAATALVTWLAARADGGRLILRVEDIDGPRVVAGAEERQLEDLRWLGLDWDEGPDRGGAHGPYRQSQRAPHYEEALRRLGDRGLLYFCDCSRTEVQRIASAPHAGEEGPRYPGLCREKGLAPRAWRRPPALRLAVPEQTVVTFLDRFQGEQRQQVFEAVGDFVLKRGDGVYSYQLAVVVDDLAMGVTEVVRGSDLVDSTPRQILLAELLGGTAPYYAHAPLVVSSDGSRLAKRARGVAPRDHRAAGRSAAAVVAELAGSLGLLEEGELADGCTPQDLLDRDRLERLRGRATVRLSPDANELARLP
jgi:glutamyl-tRNA synthetase